MKVYDLICVAVDYLQIIIKIFGKRNKILRTEHFYTQKQTNIRQFFNAIHCILLT